MNCRGVPWQAGLFEAGRNVVNDPLGNMTIEYASGLVIFDPLDETRCGSDRLAETHTHALTECVWVFSKQETNEIGK